MANFSELLLQLNLNPKQVAIFLALVRLGKATVAIIARESGVTRTHVYDLIAELVGKGLVSEVEERGVKTYAAVDHAGLLAYVSRQEKELQSIGKKLEQSATEFNALQVGRQQKTKVRFFDGVEGIKNIYEEIERDCTKGKKPSEILTIFSPANLERVLPKFSYFNFADVRGRDIVCEDALLETYRAQMNSAKNIQYKIWPESRGIFPTDTIVWGNKVAYTDLTGFPSGIIVENESIARTASMVFEGLWGGL